MIKFALCIYIASFDEEFRRFDERKLEFESLRRTGHLEPESEGSPPGGKPDPG